MKTTKIIAAGFLLSTLVLGGTQVFAAEGDQASSNATVAFTDNTGTTNPKDPKDPTKDPDPTDPDQPQTTGQNGPLSLDVVPNYDFGSHAINLAGETFKAQVSPLTNYLQVTDNRTDVNGWTITVAASAFTDSTSGDVLEGTTLSIPAGTVRNAIANTDQGNDAGTDHAVDSAKIASEAVSLTDGQDVKIFGTKEDNAAVGKATTTALLGEGQDADGNLQIDPATLTVPAGKAKTGDFTSTLTWTTTAGVFN